MAFKTLNLEGLQYYNSKIKELFSNVNKAISDEITRATTKENEIASNLSSHITNTSNPHSVTKSQVGLSNVENKSSATIRGELTKSNITTALGYTPLNQTLKGSANGLAELDSNGKVPPSQLPSYVDDIIEGYFYNNKFYKESAHTTVITGETGKIYIDLSTNKTYRWSGSAFVIVSETLALGETSSTAYRGDRGKTAYDHSQSTHAPSNARANVIETVKVNGTALTPSSKAVNITVPTKVSQLTNDSGYKTTDNNTTYSLSKSGSTITLTGSDGSTTSVTDSNTEYGIATTSANGLMSSTDKGKLDGIESGAQKNTITGVKGNSESSYRTGNVNITAANIGLGNVGNFKAVSTVASQGLTNTEKSNARANIGAGTSSFSGSYNDLTNKPTIPTVGNGTITITQNGTTKGTFTTNQSGNTTIALTDTDTNTTYSEATTSTSGLMSSTDKIKLDSIATGANKTIVDSSLSSTSTNPVQNKVVNSALSGKVPTTRTVNGKALSANITLSASDVGADASGSATNALSSAKSYTDTKIANLVGTAPETMDTLEELAAAIENHKDVTDALNAAIGNKVDKVSGKGLSTNDYTTAEKNKLSGIATGAEVNQNAFSNVVVGSTTVSADSKTDTLTLVGSNVTLTPDATNDKITIGITKANVTSALGYTPPTTNTTYGVATSTTLGLVKSGTDITVDSSGNVSVNDDSHNHVINNVDGLQTALNGKAINKTLTNENLNEITTPGFYNAGANNSVTNKPSEIDAFGLEVIHNASGNFYTQILYLPTQSTSYRRYCINGSWESWTQDKLTDTDTWRGIQDNLTSTSTTDSLSANQGKVLKELVDGKAASSHTHNYAGSSSAGGSASSAVKLTSSAGSTTQPVYFKDGKPTACSYTLGKSVPSNAVFTDTNTHYTSKNVVGSATATSNTTTALTNGNVYLNSVENGAVTSAHKISGSGTTTVTTDTSGNIVISSTSFSGTVDGTTWNCININRTNSAFSGIQFLTQGTPLGGIGTLTANGDFIKVDNTGKQLGAFIDTTNYSTKITSLPNLSGNVITKATKAGEGFRIKDTNNIEVGYFDAHTIGTTEKEGEAVLTAGNSKAKGTAGNSTGKILLYGDSSTFAVIKPSSGMTSNTAFVLPKTGGTLATTSDVLNVRQQLVSTDIKLPLLLAHANNTDTTQNIDSILYRNNSIYANPSTGSLYANNFYGIASGIQVEEVMSETGYTSDSTLKVYCIGRRIMIAFVNGIWTSSDTGNVTKTYSGEFNTCLKTSCARAINLSDLTDMNRCVYINEGTRDIVIKNFGKNNPQICATLVWLIS